MSKNEDQITIAKVQDEKRLVETRIKAMLETFQKDNGVLIDGIDFANYLICESGKNNLASTEISIKLYVKI